MANSQNMEHHFERVAPVYSSVRNNDPAVVKEIISCLHIYKPYLEIADIACGTGGYSKIIAAQLKSNIRLFCCDYSAEMLLECRKHMSQAFPSKHIHYCLTNANALPFADAGFDMITTFNAIHHFDLDCFSAEAARTLRPGGLLSIYTRTPEQNAHTIWGQHFPQFKQRETRLYQYERIEAAINRLPNLHVETIKEFKNVRIESVDSLLNRARKYHYSTFEMYPKNELLQSLEIFSKRLANLSNNGTIKHTAENTMVLARRI